MHYDIIIIGGGMVGASLACALQDTSFHTALIDANPISSINDQRLIALTAGSCNLLKNIGLWKDLSSHACPIKQLHISHRGKLGVTRIHANELSLATLGHLIPAHFINTALEKKLNSLSHVKVIRPAHLKNLIQHEKNIELHINAENNLKKMTATLVIGADGTHSTVRNLLDIPTQVIDYDQSALVTTVELQRDHDHVAYERFVSGGAIAMLPLLGHSYAVILTNHNQKISKLLQLNDENFLAYLQEQFGYRLGRFKGIHIRHHYPLKSVLADKTKIKNTLLIGNAAHTLHPIAAQGLNLSFYEVAQLVEKIKNSSSLENFEGEQIQLDSSQQKMSIQLSHQLTKIFSVDFSLLNAIRQIGMISLDNCTYAKNYFMTKVMGRAGEIPPLLKNNI